MKVEFPGLGTYDPTENDRAAVRLDRLGNRMGRHFDALAGDGLAIPRRGIVRRVTWHRDYVSEIYGFLQPSVGNSPSGSEEKNVKPLGLFFSKQLPDDPSASK